MQEQKACCIRINVGTIKTLHRNQHIFKLFLKISMKNESFIATEITIPKMCLNVTYKLCFCQVTDVNQKQILTKINAFQRNARKYYLLFS